MSSHKSFFSKKYIGVPVNVGANKNGSQYAPQILQKGLDISLQKWQDLSFSVENNMIEETDFIVKSYRAILTISEQIRDIILAFFNKQSLCFVGGDHSIAIGSIAAVLQQEPNLGVVWFDAHGDINTEATSPSGNAHGMPVAALMGLCSSGLNDVAKTRLKPGNIYWVGVRSLDAGEKVTLHRLGIEDNVYTAEYVRAHGMTAVMADIRGKMRERGIVQTHLSFDIDGMDPTIVAATGTRVANGLLQEDFDEFAAGLSTLPPLRSMDFVEYNPLLDDVAYTTGHWCVDALKRLTQCME